MAHNSNRFERRFVTESGARVRYRAAVCGGCGRAELVRDNSNRNNLPPEMVGKKLRELGWHIAPRAKGDRCPTCCAPREKLPPLPEISATEDEPMNDVTKITAIPPRQPTVADRRKIHDQLEIDYDVDAQRYRANGTDVLIAHRLDVPRAWVTDIRTALFGPEANEANAQRDAELDALSIRAKALEEKAMALAADAEAIGREVIKLRR